MKKNSKYMKYIKSYLYLKDLWYFPIYDGKYVIQTVYIPYGSRKMSMFIEFGKINSRGFPGSPWPDHHTQIAKLALQFPAYVRITPIDQTRLNEETLNLLMNALQEPYCIYDMQFNTLWDAILYGIDYEMHWNIKNKWKIPNYYELPLDEDR